MPISKWSLIVLSLLTVLSVTAQEEMDLTAADIMSVVKNNQRLERHVYEEISAILTDQAGRRDTRQLRKYTRITDNNAIKFLLVFDKPEEYEGVAILVEQVMETEPDVFLYLPASGELLKHLSLWNDNEGLFGMDFSLSQISNIFNDEYQYKRQADRKIGDVNYYVIDVYGNSEDANNSRRIMTHQIRQDDMFVTRTNFYDQNDIVFKQLSMHNLNKNSADVLSASMLYMTDRNKLHSTLIKVKKRVISDSLVSNDVFTANWMLENKPPLDLSPTEEEQLESELIDAGVNDFDNSIATVPQSRGYQ